MFKVVSIKTERISQEQFEMEKSKSIDDITTEALDAQINSVLIDVQVVDGFNGELIVNDKIPFEEVTQWIDDSNYVHFNSKEDEIAFNQCVKHFNQ